jgi:putative IMPACT (imprinted ancient) family translation regulator
MRAYGGTAAEALRTAERQTESPRVAVRAEAGFEHINALYRALDACAAENRHEDYTEQGVKISATLPANELERFRALLRDGTRGQFELAVAAGNNG